MSDTNSYFDKSATDPVKKPMEEDLESLQFARTEMTGDKVFFIVGDEAHWVKNPEALAAVGGNFDMVRIISVETFRKFNTRVEPITIESAGRYYKKIEEQPIKQSPVVEADIVTPEIRTKFTPGMTSIIIPAFFNSYPIFHYTGNCIGSVREHTDSKVTPYEIILIVNGKTGIGFKEPKDSNADKLITNEENRGYSFAMNQGIRMSQGEYIVLLNNDTMVFDNWLPDMQEALNHGLDMVMATPMYGKPYARAKEAAEIREREMRGPVENTYSDFADFACAAMKKGLFDEVGVFNEQFFSYCGDLDFMRRMNKKNKKFASSKRVNIFHVIGATSIGIDDTPQQMNEAKEKLKKIWGF